MKIIDFLPVGQPFKYKYGRYSITVPQGMCISLGILCCLTESPKLLAVDDRGNVFEHAFSSGSTMALDPYSNFELL